MDYVSIFKEFGVVGVLAFIIWLQYKKLDKRLNTDVNLLDMVQVSHKMIKQDARISRVDADLSKLAETMSMFIMKTGENSARLWESVNDMKKQMGEMGGDVRNQMAEMKYEMNAQMKEMSSKISNMAEVISTFMENGDNLSDSKKRRMLDRKIAEITR